MEGQMGSEVKASRSHPSIDHTLLSPSGKVSKRARKAMLAREAARLFPPGTFSQPEKTEAEKLTERANTLNQSAARLRELAARGMKPRAYLKAAERMESEAAALSKGAA
jgi:hypothetical protein